MSSTRSTRWLRALFTAKLPRLGRRGPCAGSLLESMARVEGAQERALIPGFVCYWPSSRGTDGSVLYDQAGLRASEVESPCVQPGQDPSALRTLDAAHTNALEASAASDRSRAQELVMAGAFVIVAVFSSPSPTWAGATAGHVLWQPA